MPCINVDIKPISVSPKVSIGIVCKVSAEKPYLIVPEGFIEMDLLGTPVSVAVESNMNWQIVFEELWRDGGSLSVEYQGKKDGLAVFSSDVNEGKDREKVVTFQDSLQRITEERTVRQRGRRQAFGNFILANGGTFNVLKNEQ